MMRWLIFAVVVVAVTAGATIALQYLPETTGSPVPAARKANLGGGPPPLAVVEEEPVFQFGEMSEETEKTKTWKVKNEGKGELRLTLLETSCTCTNVRFGEAGEKLNNGDIVTIEPGQEKELFFTWNSKNRIGQFGSNVRFATNDFEKNPSLTFAVQGEVLPAVVVFPPALEFGDASSETVTMASIAVYSPSRPELKIEEVTSSRPDLIVAEVTPLTDEQKADLSGEEKKVESGYEVKVRIEPGMALGRFRDALVIKTDHPARPRVDVPMSGRVVGPISTVPASIFMPGVSSKAGGEQEVIVTVRGQEQTQFEVVLPDEIKDSIAVQINPNGEDLTSGGAVPVRKYRMTVKVPAGTKSGPLNGVILLKSDHPNAGEVKIPIQAFIQSN